MNRNSLRNVIHLRFHFAQLLRLQVQQLQIIVGQRIDLIRNTGQRLGGVVFRFFECSLLILGSEHKVRNVRLIAVAVYSLPPSSPNYL